MSWKFKWSLPAIAVSIALLTFLFGNSILTRISSHFSPASVKLVGGPRTLRLLEEAEFKVLVDDHDAAGQYQCHWTVDGTAPGRDIGSGAKQDDCRPYSVQNRGEGFQPNQESRTITIGVEVWDNSGRRINSTAEDLTLVNEGSPEIEANPHEIPLNGSTTLRARIWVPEKVRLKHGIEDPAYRDWKNIPNGYRCVWSVAGEELPQQSSQGDCSDYHYKASGNLPVQERDPFPVELKLIDLAGTIVGRKSEKTGLFVVRPLSNFFIFELDTTMRMNPPGGPGLKRAIVDIQSAIRVKRSVLAQVGIKTFGTPRPHSDPGDCGMVETVYRLQPLDYDAAARSLDGTTISGNNAPVVTAITDALNDFKAFFDRPAARFELAVVTTGPDTCGGGNTEEDLASIDTAITSVGAERLLVDFKLLTLTIRVAPTQEAARKAMQEAEARYKKMDVHGANLLLPITVADLDAALDAAGALLQADAKSGRNACNTLKTLFDQVGGERSAERLESYCARIG
jgi:hypothetical protein